LSGCVTATKNRPTSSRRYKLLQSLTLSLRHNPASDA
jgi:hypothetical protein